MLRSRPSRAAPRRSPALPRLLLASLLLASGAGGAGCSGEAGLSLRPSKPHLVWIVIDALRADHLGYHGYSRDTSPFLDRLAGQSARFDRAYSHESYTLASAASYFTSTYPQTHGVLYDQPEIDVLPPELETVAEVLAKHGWATAAFVFNPHLSANLGFDQGFSVYDDAPEGWPKGPPHRRYETASRIHSKVDRYLAQRRRERPAFLYLHYRDVHGPYAAPPPYHDRFLRDGVLPAGVEPVVDFLYSPQVEQLSRAELSAARRASYDAEIRYTDEALERLTALLADHGLDRNNTVFVVTSDHGEEFQDRHPADRGGVAHGRTLYQEQLHVPLLLSLPWLEARTIHQPVGLIDLAPTLFDLLRIEVQPGGRLEAQMQGRSLKPLLAGRNLPPRPVLAGGAHGRAALLADGWKLYRYPRRLHRDRKAVFVRPEAPTDRATDEPPRVRTQLFDLRSDPAETVDLRRDRPDLRRRLNAELERLEAAALAGHAARGSADLRRAPDAESQERLRALGYL